MSDRVFTYAWPDAKRLTVLHALGFMYAKLQSTPPLVAATVLELINELSFVPGRDGRPPEPTPVNAPPNSGTAAARAVLSAPAPPSAPHDYFAADRKGKIPQSAPSGAELQTVQIVSATEKPTTTGGRCLGVIFSGRGGKANCFDAQLWPLIKKAQGHEAQLWLKVAGNYLNIVGVRA